VGEYTDDRRGRRHAQRREGGQGARRGVQEGPG
jgi:hypothetical protein